MPTALFCIRRPLKVQRQEACQDFIVHQVNRPTVGGGDGGVELAVGEVEPGGAGVVEVGERALGESLRALFVFGDKAGVADG
ncbi:MAG: hypothetical protein WD894_16225 [Pirellulales bacterium]